MDAELLTTPEAAIVAGVSVRDVNRVIDENILPEELYNLENNRRIHAAACALVDFYIRTADTLTAHERSRIIQSLWVESKAKPSAWKIRNWKRSLPKWKVRHSFLTINFDEFLESTIERHGRLSEARSIVVEDPNILGGTPVIKGTRIPVYDVAASIESGSSVERLISAYPSLDKHLIDLAVLYAKATPPRGRPKAAIDEIAPTHRKTVRRRNA